MEEKEEKKEEGKEEKRKEEKRQVPYQKQNPVSVTSAHYYCQNNCDSNSSHLPIHLIYSDATIIITS